MVATQQCSDYCLQMANAMVEGASFKYGYTNDKMGLENPEWGGWLSLSLAENQILVSNLLQKYLGLILSFLNLPKVLVKIYKIPS